MFVAVLLLTVFVASGFTHRHHSKRHNSEKKEMKCEQSKGHEQCPMVKGEFERKGKHGPKGKFEMKEGRGFRGERRHKDTTTTIEKTINGKTSYVEVGSPLNPFQVARLYANQTL